MFTWLNTIWDAIAALRLPDTQPLPIAAPAVQLSEAYLQALFDASPDAMLVHNAQGVITMVNRQAAHLLGYLSDELVGLPIKVVIPQCCCVDILKHTEAPSSSPEQVQSVEGCMTKALRKDGRALEVEISVSPISSTQGLFYTSALRDITERKAVEAKLKASEERFRRMANSSPIIIWMTNAAGEPVFANQTWFDFTGHDANTPLTLNLWRATVHPDDCEAALQTHEAPRQGANTISYEYRLRNHSAEWRWMIANQLPLYDERGTFSGYIGSAIDITERKLVQQRLEESERMLSDSQRIACVGSWSLDFATQRMNWSKAMFTIFALEPSAFDHTLDCMLACMHPEDLPSMHAWLAQCRAGEALQDHYFRILHNAVEIRYILFSAGLQYDAQQHPLRLLGSAKDLTHLKQAEMALRASEARYRAVTQSSKDAIIITNDAGLILNWNPGAERVFGYQEFEIVGQPVFVLMPTRYRDHCAASIRRTMAGSESRIVGKTMEFEGLRKNQQVFPLEISVSAWQTSEGRFFSGTIRDISERKLAEMELRVAATAFESNDAMVITDAQAIILRINQAFTHLTGYTPEEAVGQHMNLLQSGEHDRAFYAAMWDTIRAQGSWQGEIRDKRKNGEVYPKWLTITAVKDARGVVTHYIGVHLDISTRKLAEEEIKLLAFYDTLTQLPNRRLLQERLKLALAASHRSKHKGGLLFIDLDNFKTLNDSLGHDMGDLLLQQVAARLLRCVREQDTVARLGGDEFVVMVEGLNGDVLEAAAQIEMIGNNIISALNQPYQLALYDYLSTASIGATVFSNHEQTVDELLKQADIAMYQAKAAGRNTFRFFDPQMQAKLTERIGLEMDLRRALAEQQFELYYQAQVHENNRIVGAEILIRWRHPQRGLVSPADFIPLAEETGLIVAIGDWVLDLACKQLQQWATQPDTAALQLAVNVSARQFRQPEFVEQVCAKLQYYAIQPNRLKLELTESLVLDNIEETIAKMQLLRQRGVGFSMDDFGTGYSSLSCIKKLPIDQLKIDQSFVQDLTTDSEDAVIVQTIIDMTKNLHLEVIAEGVETLAQRQFLAAHECSLYQGYLFSKPVPLTQFERLLRTYQHTLDS